MTTTEDIRAQGAADRFGRRVAARLSAGLDELPYEVAERLRASRMQALAVRKRLQSARAPQLLASADGTATIGFGEDKMSFWQRIGSVLPLVVLVAGLVLIHAKQNDFRASEIAEVDVALLTDELPPAAYADVGFVQFLKTHRE